MPTAARNIAAFKRYVLQIDDFCLTFCHSVGYCCVSRLEKLARHRNIQIHNVIFLLSSRK